MDPESASLTEIIYAWLPERQWVPRPKWWKMMKARRTRNITRTCVYIYIYKYTMYMHILYIDRHVHIIHAYLYKHTQYTRIKYRIQYISKSSGLCLKWNIKTHLQHHPPSRCRVLNPGDWDLRLLSESTQLLAKILQGHGPGAHQLCPDLSTDPRTQGKLYRKYPDNVYNLCASIEYRYLIRLWFTEFRMS